MESKILNKKKLTNKKISNIENLAIPYKIGMN